MSNFKPHELTAQTLIRVREERGISKNKLSKQLKVSAQFYGHIESGAVALPSVYVKKVCKLLNVDIETIIGAMIADYARRVRRGFNESKTTKGNHSPQTDC